MKRMYKQLLLLWVGSCMLLLAPGTHAQQSALGCVMHLNKPFFVNGETIWYKLYLPPALQQPGAVLRFELLHPGGNSYSSHFQQLNGRQYLQGYFPLSYDQPAAMYHLLVTAKKAGKPEDVLLLNMPVPIYSDVEIPALNNLPAPGQIPRQRPKTPQGLQIRVLPEKTTYSARQRVQVQIEVLDANGRPVDAQASVSVTDASLLPLLSNLPAHLREGPAQLSYQPLDTAMTFQGLLLDSLQQPLFSGTLSAYLPQSQQFFTTYTNGEGAFELRLPRLYGEVSLQFADPHNPYIVVQSRRYISLPTASPLPYSAEIIDYLRYSQERKKIYQLFGQVESPLNPERPAEQVDSLLPDRRIIPANYEPFPDLHTFFREILTPLKLRVDQNGKWVYRMLNVQGRSKSLYADAPVFIVNQYIVRQPELIGQLHFSDIQYIDLFNDYDRLMELFGALGKNGVVMIRSSQDLRFLEEATTAGRVQLHALLPPAAFPAAAQAAAEGPHQPLLRPQVYWNAGLKVEGGRGGLEFWHTDDQGLFHIEVLAQDAHGRMGYARAEYRVGGN